MNDNDFMEAAYDMAKVAYSKDEVPVGAVVVLDGKIIGKGYNQKIERVSPIWHAEMMAIDEASNFLGDWRLENCTLYVTLEPCSMCKGAIMESRISRVVYGISRDKQEFVFDFWGNGIVVENMNWDKCALILSDFFNKKR